MWKSEIGSGGILLSEGLRYPFLDRRENIQLGNGGGNRTSGQPTKFKVDKAPKVLITCNSTSLEVAETAQLTGDDRANHFCSWQLAHRQEASGSQVLDYD